MSARLLGTVRVIAQEHGAGRAKSAEVPEEYRAIFEAATDGLIINDLATGRIVEVNPALCRMHGYRREELIGSLPTKFIHPDDHPLFTDFADTVQHGQEFRARRRDVTKDGRIFDVEVRGIQMPFRGRPHMLGVVRDITEEAAALPAARRAGRQPDPRAVRAARRGAAPGQCHRPSRHPAHAQPGGRRCADPVRLLRLAAGAGLPGAGHRWGRQRRGPAGPASPGGPAAPGRGACPQPRRRNQRRAVRRARRRRARPRRGPRSPRPSAGGGRRADGGARRHPARAAPVSPRRRSPPPRRWPAMSP